MAFVTRYRIEDAKGDCWTGQVFTSDDSLWEEYRDADEAQDAADVVGGSVERFQRFSRIADAPRLPVFHLSIAAE